MADTRRLEAEALAVIRDSTAERLKRAPEYIDADRSFAELGLDSVMLLELSSRLAEHFRVEVADFAAYEHATPGELAAYVAALVAAGTGSWSKSAGGERELEDDAGTPLVLPPWPAKSGR
jgi:acyl carrier protein